MSSGRRSLLQRATLRTQLLAVLLSLTTVALVGVGAATTLAMKGYLLARTDSTVLAVRDAVVRAALDPDDLRLPSTTVSSADLAARIDTGVVLWRRADSDERQVPPGRLTAEERARLPTGPHPATLELGGQRYRVAGARLPDGVPVAVGVSLEETDETIGRLLRVELVTFALVLVLVAVAGSVLVPLTLRPLRRVATAARAVSRTPLVAGEVTLRPDLPPTDPRTEVGAVAAAVTAMIGHVEASINERADVEARLRRFVADAGHELRTPLAALTGHAELLARSADDHPEQVPVSAARMLAAARRMGRLVDDLLLLARLDEHAAVLADGYGPLARAAVALPDLLEEAVDEARAAGPDHAWLLAPCPDLTVDGDPERLHQVVANLLANARIHTPAGTSVRVSLARCDGLARITVADDGPGIPADLLPRVTERFVRGDSSRSRSTGGSGLGLAIATALVEAHGGALRLAAGESGGTTATVTLPLAREP